MRGGRRRRKLSQAKRVRALGSQVDRQKRSMLANVILKDTNENVNEGNEGLTMADLTGAVTSTLASSLVRTCGQVEAHAAAADCCLCCNITEHTASSPLGGPECFSTPGSALSRSFLQLSSDSRGCGRMSSASSQLHELAVRPSKNHV